MCQWVMHLIWMKWYNKCFTLHAMQIYDLSVYISHNFGKGLNYELEQIKVHDMVLAVEVPLTLDLSRYGRIG